MRIGIDASRANIREKTGTEWYSYFLIEEWKKIIPREYRIALYSKEPLSGVLGILPEGWESRVLRWPLGRFWTQFRFSFEMMTNPPDALFVPSHTIPLVHPKKTVTTLHDVGFERFPELYSKSELAYHRWSARLALKRAARIITVSEFSKREMIELYNVNPEKISVVHNGFDRELRRPLPKEEVRLTLAKKDIREPYLFFVGRLEEKKNVAFLVRIFARVKKHLEKEMPNLELVLAGQPGYGYEKIQRAIAESACAESIRQLGWTRGEDLAPLYNGAELFLFPSLYEGFGIPAIEAMACGTPVIASNRASLPEVVGEAGLLLSPEDESAWIEAIVDLLSHAEKREEFRQKGFLRAKLFSWERCARETWEILKSEVK